MAYISKQCVTCTEPTKRECGRYHGTDEEGHYSGPLYVCNNPICPINYGRKRPPKHSESENFKVTPDVLPDRKGR